MKATMMAPGFTNCRPGSPQAAGEVPRMFAVSSSDRASVSFGNLSKKVYGPA